jgi:uncharacterized damage-inducible protein DinB
MNLHDFMVAQIEAAREMTLSQINDFADDELLVQPCPGGNHPLWLLGHIANSEDGLILSFCKGENVLPGSYFKLFGIGSTPQTAASAYPSRDEILAGMEEAHAAAIDYVGGVSPEELDRPPHGLDRLRPEAQELFHSRGACILHHALHEANHAGQMAVLRRILGKKPRV